jgi:uncharacterized protein
MSRKKALIVYGGWDGHQPKETAAIVAQDLAKSDFEVEMSETLEVFSSGDHLSTYDLIVPHWTMGEMTAEQENALLHAVENGTGVGGFHGGFGDAFRNSTGFQFMAGGQFVSHPQSLSGDYQVRIVMREDPIVAGLSDFKVYSEQYYMHTDPANEVLANTTFVSKEATWINGTIMPVVWKRKHNKGRVFYQSVGHSVKDFDIPEVREITRRGLVWAAR